MDLSIFALLVQDGITNGAIYALLALALVLVFAVTRVIWVPAGEFVAFGTLTLAALQPVDGAPPTQPPGTVSLLVGMAVIAGLMEAYACARRGERRRVPLQMAKWTGIPVLIAAAAFVLTRIDLPLWAQIGVALALVTALGPLLYRIVYQPLAEGSVLVLLIVSVAVHFALLGLGLLFFGAEGSRTPAFATGSFTVGAVTVSLQSLIVVITSLVLIAALALFFGRTLYGKALRATALNRVGARLVGVSPTFTGMLTFTLAALLCAFSGVLIGPITTVYYDSGFLISLKGFVGAIIGGLASYPLAAAGALLVGLIEAFASFFASGFKEVIVFTLIIPVLLWRSLTTQHHEEDE
jgi:branched-subunit amino acid ABC-type transport system permease component